MAVEVHTRGYMATTRRLRGWLLRRYLTAFTRASGNPEPSNSLQQAGRDASFNSLAQHSVMVPSVPPCSRTPQKGHRVRASYFTAK